MEHEFLACNINALNECAELQTQKKSNEEELEI